MYKIKESKEFILKSFFMSKPTMKDGLIHMNNLSTFPNHSNY